MKIGVLAGAFDPVHLGHVSFINNSIGQYGLDRFYVLIEKTSRYKKIFADFNERRQMLELAISSEPKIQIFDCVEQDFPISECLPKIKSQNPRAKIYLLIGKDVAEHINSWQGSKELLNGVEVIIAQRSDGITSGKIRTALVQDQLPEGLDDKVYQYIKQKELYK